LQVGADRLRQQVHVPFTLLETQTKVLGRLHETSQLLRQTGRFLQLYKKLEVTSKHEDQAILLYELGRRLQELIVN
jgi:hypothetical protein